MEKNVTDEKETGIASREGGGGEGPRGRADLAGFAFAGILEQLEALKFALKRKWQTV